MVSDRQYTDGRIADLLLFIQSLREADRDAMQAARTALEGRLDGMNEFRQALTEQATTFMPRTEAESQWLRNAERLNTLTAEHVGFLRRPEHDALLDRVSALDVRLTRTEGADSGVRSHAAEIRQTIVVSAAVLGLVLTSLIAFLDHFIH